MHEIEIKIRTKDPRTLVDRLVAQGCALSEPIHQEDTIYSRAGDPSPWERMKEGDIIVRIRRDNKGALFTLKQQCTNELDNIEHETRVEDPDNLHQALLLMGFMPMVQVRKIRRTAKLGGDEICLDEVHELGSFVELERLTDKDVDAAEVAEELYKKLESLGLSRCDEEKRGYDTQMYQLRKKDLV
jgi:adenylate cyclase, class 2